jgi:hypothetical protein
VPASPEATVDILLKLEEALARCFGVFPVPLLVFWMGKESSAAVVLENGKLAAPTEAGKALTMRGVWDYLIQSHPGVSLWAGSSRRTGAQREAEFEKFLECVQSGRWVAIGGGEWFSDTYAIPNRHQTLAAYRRMVDVADPKGRARRILLGGYAACHIDLRSVLAEGGVEVLPASEAGPTVAAAVMAAIDEGRRKQKEAEAERIRRQKGAELQRIERSEVVTLARELESSVRVVSPTTTGRITELVKYQELLEATREARNALEGEYPSGVDVEAIRLRWEELKGATNPNRFLPLVEALGGAAGRLLELLGMVEIKPPESLSASELVDYEVVETTGAADRYRLVRVWKRGYRNREGKVLCRPKICVYAVGA